MRNKADLAAKEFYKELVGDLDQLGWEALGEFNIVINLSRESKHIIIRAKMEKIVELEEVGEQ